MKAKGLGVREEQGGIDSDRCLGIRNKCVDQRRTGGGEAKWYGDRLGRELNPAIHRKGCDRWIVFQS